MEEYDVTIIGAGITGTSISRELSKYNLRTIVLEKEADISFGTTKANSGVVHAGYAATPGTQKAKFNKLGNPMFTDLCRDLSVPFKRNGTFVVALDTDNIKDLEEIQKKGIENDIKTEIITNKEKIFKLEPNLTKNVQAILNAPTGGIVSPYELAIGLAENAYTNGVEFSFNSPVTAIDKKKDSFKISYGKTNNSLLTNIVVNAAGLYSDKVANMVGLTDFTINPRRGEYVLFEKKSIEINHILFPLPTKKSKGILAAPTMHGHPFLGPNAIDIEDKEDNATTSVGLNEIIDGGLRLLPNLPLRKSIAIFAGNRAVASTNDFIIGESNINNFINAAGIQSPGLTAAPAIGKFIGDLISKILEPNVNSKFNPTRINPPIQFQSLSEFEKENLIKTDKKYANIICRCELVTEADIIDAIRRPVGATTLDGIKFRTRATMGRCQAGFCTFRILKIMEKELGLKPEEVTKKGGKSFMVTGRTKDLRMEGL